MKLKRYRVPIVFTCLITVFLMGISVLENLTEPIKEVTSDPEIDEISRPTGALNIEDEVFISPVSSSIELVRYYYEVGNKNNEKALDYFEGVYRKSEGLDYASESPFEVYASLSGEVTHVREDSLFGKCVTIECMNDITLIYQSLSEVNVSEGSSLEQGSLIGKSGHNIYEADLGNHVHFTVEKDDKPINPLSLINKSSN